MDKILERHKLPILIQEEVENLNRATGDCASNQKTSNKEKARTRCLRRINTNTSQPLPKNRKGNFS